MLKALFKKQFAELYRFFFQNRKTGKSRSKVSTALFTLLFVFLFGYLGFAFFMISMSFATKFIPAGLDWLHFALTGIIALALGVFGSVFNTYSVLYHAKDNEMLLSMPIPPSAILLVRMVSVYVLGLIYEAIIFIPAIIAYAVAGGAPVNILFAVLGMIVLSFVILVLTCFLGWIIALISSKLKNKSIITVIVSLVLFGAYYALCFNSADLFDTLAESGESVASSLKSSFYPAYVFGRGCSGDVPMLIISVIAAAALLAVTVFIMARSFIKIVTKNDSSQKVKYKAKPMKENGIFGALLKKEFKHFVSSATYMLNSSLGSVFMIAGGVLVMIAGPGLRGGLAEAGAPDGLTTVIVAYAASMISSMCTITASSISLEGKSFYVIRSLPVEPITAINAKLALHLIMTVPTAVFLIICASIALGIGVLGAVGAALFTSAFAFIIAEIGLILDLRRAYFDWTNETAVVKQGLPVFVGMFGGWVLSSLISGLGFVAMSVMPAYAYYFIAAAVCILAARLIYRWLSVGGVRKFASL